MRPVRPSESLKRKKSDSWSENVYQVPGGAEWTGRGYGAGESEVPETRESAAEGDRVRGTEYGAWLWPRLLLPVRDGVRVGSDDDVPGVGSVAVMMCSRPGSPDRLM